MKKTDVVCLLQGGEAYDRKYFNFYYLHITLFTNFSLCHRNCPNYSISNSFEQKRVTKKTDTSVTCRLDVSIHINGKPRLWFLHFLLSTFIITHFYCFVNMNLPFILFYLKLKDDFFVVL